MSFGGWSWGPIVLSCLGEPLAAADRAPSGLRIALDVWNSVPEWQEEAPPPPPSQYPVSAADTRRRLSELVARSRGTGGPDFQSAAAQPAEARPQQADYASGLTAAFATPQQAGAPHVVLAEAGTGVGKTLGYIAPATLWAERNGGAVWISTYTRNLQTQIEQELQRLYPDPDIRAEKVVLRKGRENYLCLLNFEEAADIARGQPERLIAIGLMARWIEATREGALIGGDFPGWMVELFGRAETLGLGDRRGECVYSACPHYRKCFIEHSVRRARQATIVVANHALVMIQAALGGLDDAYLPSRYVFDEGHHLFDAADSAFAAHLTGLHAADLRRWILGVEGGIGRGRGLRRRIEDLVTDDEDGAAALQEILIAAAGLPGDTWMSRIAAGTPRGAIEKFLMLARGQVLARAPMREQGHDLQAETQPLAEGIGLAAAEARLALVRLSQPMRRIVQRLTAKLDKEADTLDSAMRLRIQAMIRSLERRAVHQLEAWQAMLHDLLAAELAEPAVTADWFSITRIKTRETDIGLHRHWVDPTQPFAATVAATAHGLVVTSATLADSSGDIEADWQAAEARSGANHLPTHATRVRTPSPFDYAAQTRTFIITDVAKGDLEQVSAAYRELFLAAGGGGLGLFTAVSRLRAVHDRLLNPLEAAGIALHAQHVDGIDTGTLVDIFRRDEDSCLLGTDAIRDGVDVPGRSLRLIVFDRVPWPRPDILHRARKERFGGRRYDDMLTRLRLRQAFGRLIRSATDRGVFVLLDPMMPSRLYGAFPEGVTPERVGLADAITGIRGFLG